MATKPKSEDKSPPTDTRGKIVDALMELAASTAFRGHHRPRYLEGRWRVPGGFP